MSATSHEMGGRDATGQALGFGDEPERPLGDQHAQRGEARRIAANAVKLPDLLLGLKRDFPPLLGGELRPYRCIYYGRRRHCLSPAIVELFGRANRRLLLPHTLP